MGHANIQHPETGMWRCWSTVVDNWITDWMTESDYKEWLIQEAANSMREELQDFGIKHHGILHIMIVYTMLLFRVCVNSVRIGLKCVMTVIRISLWKLISNKGMTI